MKFIRYLFHVIVMPADVFFRLYSFFFDDLPLQKNVLFYVLL